MTMRVAEFRDIRTNVRDMAVAYHACVDVTERNLWATRARSVLREGMEAECSRANPDDKQRMATALAELHQLIRGTEITARSAPHRSTVPKTSTTRAAVYNKSASRAVRLRRAARSAMRRGYF